MRPQNPFSMGRSLFALSLLVLLSLALWTAGVAGAAAPLPQEGGSAYAVQAGDTLGKLAEKHYGANANWPVIWLATNARAETDASFQKIEDPNNLEVGQNVWILDARDAAGWMAKYAQQQAVPSGPPQTLRLATTSSTYDSGLLDYILPDFEKRYNAKVDVIAVGTGQAIEMGAKGDADVVLVHARAKEDKFVQDGDGINRVDVMHNDYIVVGPKADPAGIAGMEKVKDAFAKVAAVGVPFVSRGDDSGTYTKEKSIWASAGITPTVESGWYFSIGQTMGDTLIFTNEKLAYTLSDRGTWLAMQAHLPDLALLVGGASIAENKDKGLLNPYGVIPVNPQKHPGVNFELANKFAAWITSVDTQKMIGQFGVDKFGQPLFYPDSEAYKAAVK